MKQFFQKAALATAFITDVITAPIMSLKNCYDVAADWDDETDPTAVFASGALNAMTQVSAYAIAEIVTPDTHLYI